MDPLIKLKCLLDGYRLHYERACNQALMESEYGYHDSSQFARGQQFVLEYVIQDLEALKCLLEVNCDE